MGDTQPDTQDGGTVQRGGWEDGTRWVARTFIAVATVFAEYPVARALSGLRKGTVHNHRVCRDRRGSLRERVGEGERWRPGPRC